MALKVKIYRGISYLVRYKHTDGSGGALPLTGLTLYFTVKPKSFDTSADDSTALIKKTVLAVEHTNIIGGISEFRLTDQDTYITPGEYQFDFVLEDASGYASPPSLVGTFTVVGHPTNRNVGNE